jgi:Tetratricopeptide repeat
MTSFKSTRRWSTAFASLGLSGPSLTLNGPCQPDHPDTLIARGNLAMAYGTAGRTAEAIPLLEQTLADSERILGADHPRTRAW